MEEWQLRVCDEYDALDYRIECLREFMGSCGYRTMADSSDLLVWQLGAMKSYREALLARIRQWS